MPKLGVQRLGTKRSTEGFYSSESPKASMKCTVTTKQQKKKRDFLNPGALLQVDRGAAFLWPAEYILINSEIERSMQVIAEGTRWGMGWRPRGGGNDRSGDSWGGSRVRLR